jgi:hypothetical protein
VSLASVGAAVSGTAIATTIAVISTTSVDAVRNSILVGDFQQTNTARFGQSILTYLSVSEYIFCVSSRLVRSLSLHVPIFLYEFGDSKLLANLHTKILAQKVYSVSRLIGEDPRKTVPPNTQLGDPIECR